MFFTSCFLYKVRAIFKGSLTESEAEEKLSELVRFTARKSDAGHTKSIAFLKEHFRSITTLLGVPGVQRYSHTELLLNRFKEINAHKKGFYRS